jgi:SAM-dependent methyltransferase
VKKEGLFRVLKELIRFRIYLPARRLYGLLLDRYYRIDTEEIAALDSLGVPLTAGERCESTPIGEMLRVLKLLEIGPADVFLDLGCGKGRAMILAGSKPFKKIVGVDISDQLIKIAERNLQIMKPRLACKNYELVAANALDYEIPAEVTHLYLFNPFPYPILDQVLRSARRSIKEKQRKVTFIYYNPKYAREAERDHRLVKIRSVEFPHWSLYLSKCNIYQLTA